MLDVVASSKLPTFWVHIDLWRRPTDCAQVLTLNAAVVCPPCHVLHLILNYMLEVECTEPNRHVCLGWSSSHGACKSLSLYPSVSWDKSGDRRHRYSYKYFSSVRLWRLYLYLTIYLLINWLRLDSPGTLMIAFCIGFAHWQITGCRQSSFSTRSIKIVTEWCSRHQLYRDALTAKLAFDSWSVERHCESCRCLWWSYWCGCDIYDELPAMYVL